MDVIYSFNEFIMRPGFCIEISQNVVFSHLPALYISYH